MLRNKIHRGILGVFYIWRLEMKKIFKDVGIILFFVIVPLFYPILYTTIYNTEVIKNLPVAVVDNSKSSLSREYISKINATPDISVDYISKDIYDAKQLMMKEKIYGIIYIPSDFSDNIINGDKQAYVSLLSDMGSMLYYKTLMLANAEVSLAMNKDIKMQRRTSTVREEEIYAYPIEYEYIGIFNPASGFATFLIPAVLILILHQTLVIGVGLRAGTEREKSRFRHMIAVQIHHVGTLRVMLGRGLAYFMIYLLNAAYVLFVIPYIFKLPQMAHTLDVMLFIIPFLLATVFFAMTISVFVRNRETCIILFVFASVILLFLSGISWPSPAIPTFWKYFSYLFPSTFGINGFVRLNSMGASLSQIEGEIFCLFLQFVCYFFTTFIVYRREIISGHRHISDLLANLKRKRDLSHEDDI